MALFTIHKGKHRALPLYWLKWWPILVNPARIARMVQFTFSSKYDLYGYDQHNKLFGLSFGNVHKWSARYGWRYDTKKNVFILSAYCYVNGERVVQDLCECVANHKYLCEILLFDDQYRFIVSNENNQMISNIPVPKGHKRKWAVLLGVFFGGVFAAPTNIIIELKK